MPIRFLFAGLMLALALGACGDGLYVEAEAPRACITVVGQAVEGVPIPVPGRYGFRNQFEFSEGLLPGDGEYEIRLLSVTLTGDADAGADFGFVDSAEVTTFDPENPMEEGTVVIRYKRTTPPGATLVLDTSDAPVDVTKIIREGSVDLGLELVGTLSPRSFLMDVAACFSIKARHAYTL